MGYMMIHVIIICRHSHGNAQSQQQQQQRRCRRLICHYRRHGGRAEQRGAVPTVSGLDLEYRINLMRYNESMRYGRSRSKLYGEADLASVGYWPAQKNSTLGLRISVQATEQFYAQKSLADIEYTLSVCSEIIRVINW